MKNPRVLAGPLKKLKSDLETISPGSTNELYRWALEENLIDSVGLSASTTIDQYPQQYSGIQYMLYAMNENAGADNQTVWVDRIMEIFDNRNITYISRTRAGTFVEAIYGFTEIPEWFFDFLLDSVKTDTHHHPIFKKLLLFMRHNPMAAFTSPYFARHERIESLVHIWLKYCIFELRREGAGKNACKYNPETKMWELLNEGKSGLFRYLLLQSFDTTKSTKITRQIAHRVNPT